MYHLAKSLYFWATAKEGKVLANSHSVLTLCTALLHLSLRPLPPLLLCFFALPYAD